MTQYTLLTELRTRKKRHQGSRNQYQGPVGPFLRPPRRPVPTCSRPVRSHPRSPELLRTDDDPPRSGVTDEFDPPTKPDSGISRAVSRAKRHHWYLAGLRRERLNCRLQTHRCRSGRLVGEGAGSKPLSVHLSAGRIQLSILPGPVDALRTCLDLLRRGCPFQPRSGNLPSRVHRTPDMVRFCCIAGPPGPSPCDETPASREGTFLSV